MTIARGTIEWWLTLLPVFFFFLSVLVILLSSRKGKVSLNGLLEEKDVVIAAQKAGTSEAAPPSVSRLIVLLSGLTAVMISVCLTCVWIFELLEGKPKIDFGNLTDVLLVLGIGVVPYGFNKLSGALKS